MRRITPSQYAGKYRYILNIDGKNFAMAKDGFEAKDDDIIYLYSCNKNEKCDLPINVWHEIVKEEKYEFKAAKNLH